MVKDGAGAAKETERENRVTASKGSFHIRTVRAASLATGYMADRIFQYIAGSLIQGPEADPLVAGPVRTSAGRPDDIRPAYKRLERRGYF